MPNIQHKRGTRAALDALAASNGLVPWQVYAITDEDRIALALTTSTYQTFLKTGEGGTVTSVGMSVPTGLTVSGPPITSSGTLAVNYAAGYSIPATAKQAEWDTAYGWGNHATAGYLTGAAIGTTVQAYDADLTSWAAIAPSSKVDATSGTASGLTLNDGYTEEVFAVTGTAPALSPTNGSIQTWTLSGNSTPTAGTWAEGQSITLMIDDGTNRTINWTSVAPVWKTNGGSAPTLNTTGYTVIALWKVGSTIYGARVGDA